MDFDGFLENFGDLFDETDVSTIKADTIYKDLEEWSSMIALSLIAMVDEEYNVQIKSEDIRDTNTVEDLFNIVKSRA